MSLPLDSTGNHGLDEVLGGGIQRGSLAIVAGPPGRRQNNPCPPDRLSGGARGQTYDYPHRVLRADQQVDRAHAPVQFLRPGLVGRSAEYS